MKEAEWLNGNDQHPLLQHLRQAGRTTARKWRLLVCAALRDPKVWPLLVSKSSRHAVEVCEAFAEGTASGEDLTRVRKSAHRATYFQQGRPNQRLWAAGLAHNLCWHDATLLRDGVFAWTGRNAESLVPVRVIREVIGNPFRAPKFDPTWLTSTVVSLAQAAYDERVLPTGQLDPVRLAVLADALEEVGCTGDVLSHLRDPGPHVRGCWAVDLLLARN